jgi:isopentenyl-diphosphate delta-isomerase
MAEDYFDVVDFKDEVLGRALRARVHGQKLRHRAVHVLVRDERGRVLLQKRSKGKENHPGLWDSACSGHVDAGESYLLAAEREFKEELGIEATGIKALFKIEAREETGWEFVWVYEVMMAANVNFKVNEEEIEKVEFFALDAIDAEMGRRSHDFTPALRYLWPFYRLRLEPMGGANRATWV